MSKPYSYRILVCGGRNYSDWTTLSRVLTDYCHDNDLLSNFDLAADVTIIYGGAKGADLLARRWATSNYCPTLEFKADWNSHGKAAGPIRNKQMLDEGQPDVVIAFPGGSGTANMCKQARDRGVKVIEVKE